MTVHRHRFTPTDPRLGRHVAHDAASRDYPVDARKLSALKSVRHHHHIGILDQGQLGSCTGNAGTGAMASNHFWGQGQTVLALGTGDPEKFAVQLYSDATHVDDTHGTYPPDDTGSSGLAIAKVLKRRGVIGGYRHAFTFEQGLTAIHDHDCIGGLRWYEAMFEPDDQGYVDPGGDLAGGHEICFDEINVEHQYVGFRNSWGPGWGLGGRGRMSFGVFEQLVFGEDGDLTSFTKAAA